MVYRIIIRFDIYHIYTVLCYHYVSHHLNINKTPHVSNPPDLQLAPKKVEGLDGLSVSLLDTIEELN